MARQKKPKSKGISIVKGKNVSLVGFGTLAKAELAIIRDIMLTYINKIEERTDYVELKIKLKSHQHIKSFIHELKADLFIPGTVLNARASHKNLNRALAIVMTKIVVEVDRLKKKSPRERPIRKLSRKVI